MSKLAFDNHNIPQVFYALVDQNGGTHLWPLKVLYSSSLNSFKLFKLLY